MRNQDEPDRIRPNPALSAKMSNLSRRNTKPEIELRRALHRKGLRFRVQIKAPGNRRRTIDVAFTRARLAVYVDGCFWHGCPEHFVLPRTNTQWWQWKVDMNRQRDRATDADLVVAGWRVLRFWEHVDPESAADAIERLYQVRLLEVARKLSGPR